MDLVLFTLWIGVGATAIIDIWAIARRRLLGVAPPDYGLVGRWIGHMAQGRFRHERIAASPAIEAERVIGWSAHYLIGIGFAALLVVAQGADWMREPSLGPALIVGMATVAAPFLVMQPGMGAGIAASRAARPAAARVQSLVTHAIFGFGLYIAAQAAPWLQSLK